MKKNSQKSPNQQAKRHERIESEVKDDEVDSE